MSVISVESCPMRSAIATAENPMSMRSDTWLCRRSCTRMILFPHACAPSRREAVMLVFDRLAKIRSSWSKRGGSKR